MNQDMDSDTSIRYKLNVSGNLTKLYIRDGSLHRDFQYTRANMYKNQRRFVLYIQHLFHKGMVDKVVLLVIRLKEYNFILSITSHTQLQINIYF